MGQQEPVVQNKRFGRYLRGIREQRRLSLDAVEEMSLELPGRVTKSHLSRIENGQAIPTFPRMFTLSRIYGVPVSHLAERFELCIRFGMFPPAAVAKPIAEALAQARRLRIAGRHTEALLFYESLLERREEISEDERAGWAIDIKLKCINCLVKLSREASAKEECEKLLGSTGLTANQKVLTLQYFAMCCYRLGKFTVSMMAVEQAERDLANLENSEPLEASLLTMKGNLHSIGQRFSEAADAYRDAIKKFNKLSDAFEVCRTQLNLAAALLENGSLTEARKLLLKTLRAAEDAGYDRQRAFALSHLALLAYRGGDLEGAEAHCLRSNRLARPREYVSVLFRNCYYLWRIAQTREDDTGVRTNERTLRTYLSRVEDYLPEAEEFRVFLGGGKNE